MDDVLGQVVLAGADEDLGAGDAEAAVVRRHGPGADQAEVGAALRLGQAHGARPRAVGEPGRKIRSRCGMARQRVVGALAQAGVGGEGKLALENISPSARVSQLRQALAAPFGAAATPVQPPARKVA